MKIIYFDACTPDDYDRIVAYLLKKQCPMANRNKADMSLAAKVPEDLSGKMFSDLTFEETVNYGDTPLDDSNLVTEKTRWSEPQPQFAE